MSHDDEASSVLVVNDLGVEALGPKRPRQAGTRGTPTIVGGVTEDGRWQTKLGKFNLCQPVRLVRTLVDGVRASGTHDATWDGRDDNGAAVGSGVYFYRFTAGKFSESKKMVLLK